MYQFGMALAGGFQRGNPYASMETEKGEEEEYIEKRKNVQPTNCQRTEWKGWMKGIWHCSQNRSRILSLCGVWCR